MAGLQRNVRNNKYNQSPFWTPVNGAPSYEILNSIQVPDDTLIRHYQLAKVRAFQQKALDNKFKDLDYIAKEDFNTLTNFFESDENQVLSELITNFVKKMNSFYRTAEALPKTTQGWRGLTTRLQNLESILLSMQQELQMNDNKVMENTLNSVRAALQDAGLFTSGAGLKEFLKDINNIKGDLVEEIGVAWLQQLKVPNIDSIRLGNVYLNTSQANRHSGQLIQDLIAYDVSSPNLLKDVEVEYRPIGSSTYIKAPLSQLLDEMRQSSGQSQMITINDNTYDVLMSLNQISVQAKSGLKQRLWNINKSTQIAFSELGQDDIGAVRALRLLSSLNDADMEDKAFDLLDTSDDYNALANYGLGTVMAKVLHLDENGNQYVLTPAGFTTFAKRMEQLYTEYNQMAKIQKQVHLKGLESAKYGVTMGNA